MTSATEKTVGAEPAIELDGAVKRFATTVAVQGLNLCIGRGEVFGLIGPNGAGKTTTFSMICGYLKPTAGTVRVLGHAPGDSVALKGRIGCLPQDALLPANDPVADALYFYARLIGMSRQDAREAGRAALERVGLAEWGRVRCGALSHGMAKRVGLAQAFLGDPELVLLDEPTAGLDPKSAFQLREFIRQQRKSGHTIVISSHNLHELEELCDAAAVLDHGRLVTSGPMAELTRAVGEVRIVLASEAPPLAELEALPQVQAVAFDAGRRQLTLSFSSQRCDAEEVIGAALRLLLDRGQRISAVSKGRRLEERVMELV